MGSNRQRVLILPAGYKSKHFLEIDFDVQLNERIYIDIINEEADIKILGQQFVCTYIKTEATFNKKRKNTSRTEFHLSLTN